MAKTRASDLHFGLDGKFEGHQIKKGDRFVGEFINDRPDGDGIYYHADGRIEEGVWNRFNLVQEKENTQNNDLYWNGSNLPDCVNDADIWDNCFATYTDADGNKYVGEWRDNKFTVQGTFTNDNGDKYVGEYRTAKDTGKGLTPYLMALNTSGNGGITKITVKALSRC